MTDTLPRLQTLQDAEGAWVQVQGRWGAAELGQRPVWQQLQRALRSHPADAATGWDLQALQWLDHIGAQLLWRHWQYAWPQRVRLTDAQRTMLARVAALRQEPAPAPLCMMDRVNQLGLLVLHALDHFQHLVELVGQLVLDIGRLLRDPRKGPWRDFSGHLYSMGATALPITALVGFLIGVVLAYLMALQLRQFGAEAFIVNILGISLIRELGPLLGAILVAGRSGSAITAQIGVMRVTEELDAMQVMGIRHGFRLVMPRALALALAMPLISLWTTLAALAGGMLAADMTMGISAGYFLQALPDAVEIGNLVLAMAKSVVFGVFIALIGCHWGLRVQPNTQSLGAGTTASVVSSITMVIVVDALFAIAFKDVGF
ncbi:MlaE family ABC transporter permease [Comamonas aquatica]|uniref:Probable phospholipid ABC transporter permease protein mlaE n=1 Tax=Comamonas aquatica TaxID=225991 RepID=A0AA35D8W3_9BURK|nr:ABC transporter permease [Comamonas aquatica]CAB5701018.1 Probable phospholipid ABC transporter permease protein mlaE [Comamonas aquatica]CAC9678120.1 Probable phospholipid ABC transporter permease protein mlaE [Comamonas aquatica]